MTVIPDNVLAAIITFVELQRVPFPDDHDFLTNHYPAIAAWLEGLGLLPPEAEEAE